MKTQQHSRRALIAGNAYHWQSLGLAIFILASALAVSSLLSVPAHDARALSAEPSLWGRGAQSMRSFLNDERADPFAQPGGAPQDPATQSVISYLRVHEVDQPVLDQLIERARYYLRGN